MVKVMGKYTGHVYYSCQSQTEAYEWIHAKKIFESSLSHWFLLKSALSQSSSLPDYRQ